MTDVNKLIVSYLQQIGLAEDAKSVASTLNINVDELEADDSIRQQVLSALTQHADNNNNTNTAAKKEELPSNSDESTMIDANTGLPVAQPVVTADDDDEGVAPYIYALSAEDIPSLLPVEHRYPLPEFATQYIATHQQGTRVTTFNNEGNYVATGALDNAVKLIDVPEMKRSKPGERGPGVKLANPVKPVLRTFYGHEAPINDLVFHPLQDFLFSCGKDMQICMFDLRPRSANMPMRTFKDSFNVRSISVHPTGDYLLSGTDHNVVRMYDFTTKQTFAPIKGHHSGPLTQVRWSPNGGTYATCSRDGAIKLWDGVNNTVIHTFAKAHGGSPVNSVIFSKTQKYLLSAGGDNMVKLWDVATMKMVLEFSGCHMGERRMQARFTHDEGYVMCPNSRSQVYMWNSHTGEVVQRLDTGHKGTVRWLSTSPSELSFMTCSDDRRSRYWIPRAVQLTL